MQLCTTFKHACTLYGFGSRALSISTSVTFATCTGVMQALTMNSIACHDCNMFGNMLGICNKNGPMSIINLPSPPPVPITFLTLLYLLSITFLSVYTSIWHEWNDLF